MARIEQEWISNYWCPRILYVDVTVMLVVQPDGSHSYKRDILSICTINCHLKISTMVSKWSGSSCSKGR